jgi:hypothetical protein
MNKDEVVLEQEAQEVDSTLLASEEDLVSDARAGLSPSEMVERKLVSLLQSMPLPVSRLHGAGPRRGLS